MLQVLNKSGTENSQSSFVFVFSAKANKTIEKVKTFVNNRTLNSIKETTN